MSEAVVNRLMESLSQASEAELAAVLASLSQPRRQPEPVARGAERPLPPPRTAPVVTCSVKWV